MQRSHPPCKRLLSLKSCCSIYLNAADGLLWSSKDECLPTDDDTIVKVALAIEQKQSNNRFLAKTSSITEDDLTRLISSSLNITTEQYCDDGVPFVLKSEMAISAIITGIFLTVLIVIALLLL